MFIGQGKALNKEQLIDISEQMDEGDTIKLNMIVEAVNSINYGVMIVAFLFFFIGGYLLYASLFAAIG